MLPRGVGPCSAQQRGHARWRGHGRRGCSHSAGLRREWMGSKEQCVAGGLDGLGCLYGYSVL